MYHIKKDKRMLKSAVLICDGLTELLKTKSYAEISITDVCDSKGIARTTFYRLFDTLDDVLLYQFDSIFEESIRQYSDAKKPYTEVLLQFAMHNQVLITTIINIGRNDLFDFPARAKQGAIIQNLDLNISETDWQYCSSILNYLLYGVLSTWVKNGCVETAEQLYKILKREMHIIYRSI